MVLVEWKMLHPKMTMEHLGLIPFWLDDASEKTAQEQLNDGYHQFGGFQPFKGFELQDDNSLKYPGDPKMKPLAEAKLRDETILFYRSAWVGIVQPDRSFVVARMD